MAIDYTDLTAIDDLLKYTYGEAINKSFVDAPITYNQFQKSSRKPGGKGYAFFIDYENPQSAGSRHESGHLPDPLVGKMDNGLIKPKYAYQTMRITGPSMEAGKGDASAFADTLEYQINGAYASILDLLNRQSQGDGFGLIGTLSANSGTLSTSTTWTAPFDNDLGLLWAREGELVDFFLSTVFDESAVASRISSINHQTKTCTFEANASDYKTNHPIVAARSYSVAEAVVASGSYMIRIGTRANGFATTDTPAELTGLLGIFDDGTLLATFEGITVATYPKWQANVLDNSSVKRELTLDMMLQAVDLCRFRAAGKNIKIRMGLGQRRKYFDLLRPDLRFAPGKLKGGYEELTFAAGDGSCTIVVDPMTHPNYMFFEPEGTIKKYELTPLGFGGIDAKTIQVSGYDEYDKFLRIYTNLGVEQRNCLTVISDLVAPAIFT